MTPPNNPRWPLGHQGEPLDELIERELRQASSYEEARAAILRQLLARGQQMNPEVLGAILESHLGGDVVELDANGQPVNPHLRRWHSNG